MIENTFIKLILGIRYSICIRAESGYCCVEYTPCTDDNSWSIDKNDAALANQASITGTECTEDFVGISGKHPL